MNKFTDKNVSCISIHAPARGATHKVFEYANDSIISIHAPARGATYCRGSGICASSNFNPRSREGSDKRFNSIVKLLAYFNPRSREGSDTSYMFLIRDARISIHAPARGATLVEMSYGVTICLFQSTLPRGERRKRCPQSSQIIHFNPRSREGSDGFWSHFFQG